MTIAPSDSTRVSADTQTLAHEATVVLAAAGQMLKDIPLDWDDYLRLVRAEERISAAMAEVLS